MNIALIPGRLGSERLRRKNLAVLGGQSLITRAIRKARNSGVFDEVWVSASEPELGQIAEEQGVHFHRRPAFLSEGKYTCEDYVLDFLQEHECDRLFEVQVTSPLLDREDVIRFFYTVRNNPDYDTFLTVCRSSEEHIFVPLVGRIHETAPVNFSFRHKEGSQYLPPVSRITWGFSSWRRSTFLASHAEERPSRAGVYSGRIFLWPVDKTKGLTVKTQEDLDMAEQIMGMAA